MLGKIQSFQSRLGRLAACLASAMVAAVGGLELTQSTARGQEELARIEADIDLNDENYQAWRDHILPNEREMAWEKIPWLTTFKDGIAAAGAAEKPLLLWTMNGHPLGCT
jgi:hypothetical protein